MTSPRAYGGKTADERRGERQARLVEAALDVISAQGVAGLTVHRLCRAARLNERYFYESFTALDDVLEAVVESLGGGLITSLAQALAGAGTEPRARATAAIGSVVDLVAADPRLGAVLVESASHPLLAARRRAYLDVVVELVISEGASTLHLERTPALEPWARFTATFLSGGLVEALGAWSSGAVVLSRDQFVDHAVGLFLAAATTPTAPPSPSV